MIAICKGCDRSGPRDYVVLERPTRRDLVGLDDEYEARDLLEAATHEALIHALERARKLDGTAYAAFEMWRMVSNARDHVARVIRRLSGLDERGDPCLPSW